MAQQEPPVTEARQPAQPEPPGRSRDRLGSALILTGVILLVLVAAGWGWLWWSQRDDRAARAEAQAVADAERQAIEVIHRWAQVSVEARRTLNPDLFDEVYQPGSDLERVAKESVEDLRRQQVRMEFTREIRSVEVKESSRDRVVAVMVWEDSRREFKDIRTDQLVAEDTGERKTNELEVRLIDGRWLVTGNVGLKTEPLPGASAPTDQSAPEDVDAEP